MEDASYILQRGPLTALLFTEPSMGVPHILKKPSQGLQGAELSLSMTTTSPLLTTLKLTSLSETILRFLFLHKT